MARRLLVNTAYKFRNPKYPKEYRKGQPVKRKNSVGNGFTIFILLVVGIPIGIALIVQKIVQAITTVFQNHPFLSWGAVIVFALLVLLVVGLRVFNHVDEMIRLGHQVEQEEEAARNNA